MTVGYDFPGQQALDSTLHQIRTLLATDPAPLAAANAGLGRLKVYGTGILTSAATGNGRITVENPTGSGHKISILAVVLNSSIAAQAEVLINPTTGAPATAARPALNYLVGGGSAPVAVVRADSNAVTPMSGGTAPGVHWGIGSGVPRDVSLKAPLVLPIGTKLGLAIPFSAGYTFSAVFTILEEPV